MKVVVFLTYNYSLQTWLNSGTLNRELEIYKQISNINSTEFTFYTYGGSDDIDLIKNFSKFKVVPMFEKITNKSKLSKFLYSLFSKFILLNVKYTIHYVINILLYVKKIIHITTLCKK